VAAALAEAVLAADVVERAPGFHARADAWAAAQLAQEREKRARQMKRYKSGQDLRPGRLLAPERLRLANAVGCRSARVMEALLQQRGQRAVIAALLAEEVANLIQDTAHETWQASLCARAAAEDEAELIFPAPWEVEDKAELIFSAPWE
ncbi:unnamed protein product, partial [Phaeothamnion confervicola]